MGDFHSCREKQERRIREEEGKEKQVKIVRILAHSSILKKESDYFREILQEDEEEDVERNLRNERMNEDGKEKDRDRDEGKEDDKDEEKEEEGEEEEEEDQEGSLKELERRLVDELAKMGMSESSVSVYVIFMGF